MALLVMSTPMTVIRPRLLYTIDHGTATKITILREIVLKRLTITGDEHNSYESIDRSFEGAINEGVNVIWCSIVRSVKNTSISMFRDALHIWVDIF